MRCFAHKIYQIRIYDIIPLNIISAQVCFQLREKICYSKLCALMRIVLAKYNILSLDIISLLIGISLEGLCTIDTKNTSLTDHIYLS